MAKDGKKTIGSTFRKIRLFFYLIALIVIAGIFSPLFSGHLGITNPATETGTESTAPVKTAPPVYFKIVIDDTGFTVNGETVSATEAAKRAFESKKQIELEYSPTARTPAEEEINEALKALGLEVARVTKPEHQPAESK